MAIILSLPQPQLAPANPVLMLEEPLNITLAAISYSDGVAIGENDISKNGVFIYRNLTAGGSEEIWNDQDKLWQPASGDVASLNPLPFSFKQGEAYPWQTMLVAMGTKDKNQQDQFAKASGGYPRYCLRAFLQAKRDNQRYQSSSAPTAQWEFASSAEKQRFGISFGSGETPQNATKIRLQLKTPSLSPAGYLDIKSAGGNSVEIANCDASGNSLARIVLLASGEIQLIPATGQKVLINSEIEVGKVYYQPSGGGAKQWLS